MLTTRSNRIVRASLLVMPLVVMLSELTAQVYTNKESGKNNQALIDSIKKTEYPYLLPIWGKKVAKKGFNLPYSGGLGVNVLWQKSDLVIDNLQIGFNNGPMHDIDEIVRIHTAISEATALNVRPDVWILPFLNVYGIFAAGEPSTTVGFGVYIPDSSDNWNKVMDYTTEANFTSSTVGFGLTPTIGVGGGWFALDMNFTWTSVSALDKPTFGYVFGPRFGKSFKLKKPEQVATMWIGGFRLKFGSETNGSINLSEVVSGDGSAAAKIDAGQEKVIEAQTGIDTWWNSLPPAQQNNPVNKAKYETANRALAKAGDILNAAEGAINKVGESSVQYSLDKRVKDMWNFIIGAQFQLNKHWMIRGEYGFLGSRKQFLGGLQYRFGL